MACDHPATSSQAILIGMGMGNGETRQLLNLRYVRLRVACHAIFGLGHDVIQCPEDLPPIPLLMWNVCKNANSL